MTSLALVSKVFELLCRASASVRFELTAHLITEARSLVRGALLAASRLFSCLRGGASGSRNDLQAGGAGAAQMPSNLPEDDWRRRVILMRAAPVFCGVAV